MNQESKMFSIRFYGSPFPLSCPSSFGLFSFIHSVVFVALLLCCFHIFFHVRISDLFIHLYIFFYPTLNSLSEISLAYVCVCVCVWGCGGGCVCVWVWCGGGGVG